MGRTGKSAFSLCLFLLVWGHTQCAGFNTGSVLRYYACPRSLKGHIWCRVLNQVRGMQDKYPTSCTLSGPESTFVYPLSGYESCDLENII